MAQLIKFCNFVKEQTEIKKGDLTAHIKIAPRIAIVAILSIICCSTAHCSAQRKGDIFNTIAKYIQRGDSDKLSIWFAEDLDISISGEEVHSSKTQAKYILKDFFENHSPQKFVILNKSGNPNMKYSIGQLQCVDGESFRIILLVRNLNSSQVIVRLRIERE